jgi:DNA-binding beta-propeller fold protein YncE
MPAPRSLLSFVFAVTAVLLWAPAAAADSLTHLSIGYSDMVVDEANEQVFVSGGPGSASIVVLDLEDGDAISKIDTATLTESGRLAVAPKSEPHAVALAGGRVWFGHDCGDPESGMSSMATDGSDLT